MSVNKQIVVGRVGKDPEVRHTQNGNAVCTLSVAVNERIKQGDDWVDHTEWFSVVVWGKDAENAGKYLAKGRWVYAEGPSRMRTWKDKDGNERLSREIQAREVKYVGGREGGGDAKRQREDQTAGDASRDYYDDDLPF